MFVVPLPVFKTVALEFDSLPNQSPATLCCESQSLVSLPKDESDHFVYRVVYGLGAVASDLGADVLAWRSRL